MPGPPFVDHAEWAKWGDLSSLRVYPTDAARLAAGQPGTDAQADEAWTEVLTLSPDADIPGMRDQFMCHWQFAELAEPGKTSWNLEPWRPEVSDEADGRDGLQSRRHRRTVLSAALQPRERGRARRPHAAQTRGHRGRRARCCDEAAELGVYAVCVSPSMVAAAKSLRTGGSDIASVVGFPSGKHLSAIKAAEAALAVAAGADEIDMVIDVGAAVAGDFDAVRADIAAVRAAIPRQRSSR